MSRAGVQMQTGIARGRFGRNVLPALLPAIMLSAAPALAQVKSAAHTPSAVVEQASPGRFETPYFSAKTRIIPLTKTITAHNGSRLGEEGGIAGSCLPVQITYTNAANFTGGVSLNLQSGMVETEIAAVTYVLPAEAFPVIIRTTEMVWGRPASAVVQTTNYSIMFWAGNPSTGTLVNSFSSSDQPGDPPPIIIQPSGTPFGINVQLTIDAGDPEQVIINDNGSHSFSIGYRIDDHNNEPTGACTCSGLGQLPAVCCPPSQSTNTFPASDADGHTSAVNNWLFARTCPGASGICNLLAPAGWHNFTALGMPTGDWVIRATYEPFGCSLPTGACCLQNGTQCAPGITQSACLSAGGVYRGDGTNCSTPCPQPTGACCINGVCSQLSQPDCVSQGGTFTSVGTACGANTCKGACCIASTQSCATLTAANCTTAGGTFQGIGTTCASFVCFPIGACCLENGDCHPIAVSPAACLALGGTFAGHQTTCATANCQPPIGACCLSGTACLTEVTPGDCAAVGGTFAGANTVCSSFTCPFCPGDIVDNHAVDVGDLLAVITAWGPCSNCIQDIAPAPFGDNQVNVGDLLLVITSWGACQ